MKCFSRMFFVFLVSLFFVNGVAKADAAPITHYDPQGRIDYIEYFDGVSSTPISTKVYKYILWAPPYVDMTPYQIIEYVGAKGTLQPPYLDPHYTGNGYFDPYLNHFAGPGGNYSPAFPRTSQKNIKSLTIFYYTYHDWRGTSEVYFGNDLTDTERTRYFDQDANGSFETSEKESYYFAGTRQKRADISQVFHWSDDNTSLVSYEYLITQWDKAGSQVGSKRKIIFTYNFQGRVKNIVDYLYNSKGEQFIRAIVNISYSGGKKSSESTREYELISGEKSTRPTHYSSQQFDSNGKVTKSREITTTYHPNGKVAAYEDKAINTNGQSTHTKQYFNESGILEKIEDFDPITGKLIQTRTPAPPKPRKAMDFFGSMHADEEWIITSALAKQAVLQAANEKEIQGAKLVGDRVDANSKTNQLQKI